MNVAGMSVKGRILAIVVFSITDGQYQILKTTPKIELTDSDSQEAVKFFNSILESFVRENHIERAFLKKRGKKGEFSGGVDGFKIEALLQLLPIPLILISPQTIAATKKKAEMPIPATINKYQIEAFETGHCGIAKHA